MTVKDKVAIVTGASMGIGEAVARLLTKKGTRVALVARSKGKLEKLSKELPGSFVVICDMADPAAIKRMVKKVVSHYGRVDILVNNAGRGYDASIQDTDIKTFTELFKLDLIGPLIAMQQVIPVMKKNKESAIINISSGTALMALPNMAAYSSLKRALAGISLTAGEELKHYNISVGVVYPFITATNFEKNTIKEGKGLEWPEEGGSSEVPPADSADFIAEKIVKGIETKAAEIYAHDWMKR
jgi:short-subunit dehydrogenase